jgi:hypothetical protein
LRKVCYYHEETGRNLVFLNNNLSIPAVSEAALYRLRWRIELFFRWIKRHLHFKHYYGTSPNAVKTEIWIAARVYLIVAIVHQELGLPGTLHRTLQLLSVYLFKYMTLHELLTDIDFKHSEPLVSNQVLLWIL